MRAGRALVGHRRDVLDAAASRPRWSSRLDPRVALELEAELVEREAELARRLVAVLLRAQRDVRARHAVDASRSRPAGTRSPRRRRADRSDWRRSASRSRSRPGSRAPSGKASCSQAIDSRIGSEASMRFADGNAAQRHALGIAVRVVHEQRERAVQERARGQVALRLRAAQIDVDLLVRQRADAVVADLEPALAARRQARACAGAARRARARTRRRRPWASRPGAAGSRSPSAAARRASPDRARSLPRPVISVRPSYFTCSWYSVPSGRRRRVAQLDRPVRRKRRIGRSRLRVLGLARGLVGAAAEREHERKQNDEPVILHGARV